MADEAGPAAGGASAAASGWVLPALALLLGAAAGLLGGAWNHLAPGTAPPAWLLAALAVVLGVGAFSLAVTFSLDPAHAPTWWRPLVGIALIVAAGLAAVLAPRASIWAALGSAAILVLAVRAAETLGKQLAPVVRTEGEYREGDWSRQAPETRRVVLETWVVAALAMAAGPHGLVAVVGLALLGAGGLVLTAGSKVSAIERLSEREGFVWSAQDLARAWRGVLGVAFGVLVVGCAAPGLPPVLSRRFASGLFGIAEGLLGPGRAGQGAGARAGHRAPAPPLVHVPTAPVADSGHGTAAHTVSLHLPGFLRTLAILYQGVYLIPLVVVLVVIILGVRQIVAADGDWRLAVRRLWASLRGAFSFWRWLAGLRTPHDSPLAAAGEDPQAAGAPAAAPPALPGLLDPRRAIRANYRRFLRSAAGAGHPRAAAETPAVFEVRLEPVLEASAAQATALTRAYEEARYSDHPIGRGLLPRIRDAVGRVIRALQGRGRAR